MLTCPECHIALMDGFLFCPRCGRRGVEPQPPAVTAAVKKQIDELPDVLTAGHIADYLTISRKTVYELFQLAPEAGGIENFSVGSSKRATKDDFLGWIASRKQAQAFRRTG